MGNENTKNISTSKGISMTAAAVMDATYLLSAEDTSPDAWEYVIYGFIREFVEQNLWIEWNKHKVIPHAIKILLTKYLKTELIVDEGTTITLSSGVYHEFEHIVIKKNATLTVETWHSKSQKGGKLLLKTDHNITMHESAQINVDSKGYNGGYFCESGESYTGKGSKYNRANNAGGGGAGKGAKSSGYSKCRGAGGGYGGKGNDINKANGGHVYGDEFLTVLYLGSGGGGGYNNGISENESGGNGGGVIDIQCAGDIIMGKQSKICANGGNSVFGGGGSGGSIKISCKHISVHEIAAMGGMDKDGHKAGQGRIRISTKDQMILDYVAKINPHAMIDTEYVANYVE